MEPEHHIAFGPFRLETRPGRLHYTYAGQSPDVKRQIVDRAMNASGIRNTARMVHLSPNTVIKE
jgi:transposase-like protein